jgi:glycerol uptake facilitator-like aquaporin
MTRSAVPPLLRRAFAELLGTGLLVAVVVGSGIMASRLSPGQPGLELLENSVVTALGLTVIILMLAPVSGAHLNPVISAADWALGRRHGGLRPRQLTVYLPAQVAGAVGGAALANLMFALPAVSISGKGRSGAQLWLGEVVATTGLVVVIFALTRSGRGRLVPAAAGAWIGAAYWFTSSTSFANPAVTVGRVFSNTFAGIAPGSVPGFVGAQMVGGAFGIALVHVLYPARTRAEQDAAVTAQHVQRQARAPEAGTTVISS